jgi:hypothetical protein
VALGDVLGSFVVRGYGSSGFTQQSGTLGSSSPSGLSVFAAENYTDIAQGSYIYLNTTRIGSNSATNAMKIDSTGNIVIPVTTTSSNISTGALVVKGGVGIAGNLNIGGNIISNSYLFANGVSIFTTIAGSIGTYSNTNAAAYLSSNTVTTINTTGNITTSGNLVTNFITTAAGSGANLIIDPDGNADVIINAANVWLNAGYLRSTASTFQLANAYPTTAYMFGNATAIYMGAGAVNLSVGNGSGNVTAGNVLTNNHLYANGVSILTGVTYNYSNSNVSSYLTVNPQSGTYSNSNVSSYLTVNPQSGTYSNANVSAYLTTATINTTGNITANIHYGNIFAFANGVNILSGVTGTYSNTNVGSYLSGGVTTGNLTILGNVVQQTAYYETYGNISNTGGNLTCNFNLGTTFYANLTANVTANFTNVNAISSTVTGATIVVDQGATAYRVANVQVNGVNQTVKWVGASAGVGTASNTDVMSFSLINLGGGVYRVLGQISNYG